MTLQPRVVQVYRQSEYDELVLRHGTRQQAAFFLQDRGRSIDELFVRHEMVSETRRLAARAIPADWRRTEIERSDLHRFRFAPEDIVMVVGQDGLVANVSKYLSGQAVIGINPEPDRNPGVLVPHRAELAPVLLRMAAAGLCTVERRTMVEAATDDGRRILAANELFYGHRSHQSARYRIELSDGAEERQSSSGWLMGPGPGAGVWLMSAGVVWGCALALPRPEQDELCFFVREAWPSAATGVEFTEGLLGGAASLVLHAESDELVCFGDGIESDSLGLTWGQRLEVTVSKKTLNLVTGGNPPQRARKPARAGGLVGGAGEGNRTPVFSLGS